MGMLYGLQNKNVFSLRVLLVWRTVSGRVFRDLGAEGSLAEFTGLYWSVRSVTITTDCFIRELKCF